MKVVAYTIYDKVALNYTCPQYAVNVDVVKRNFKAFLSKIGQLGEVDDYKCYLVGEFDISSGEFTPFKNICEVIL